MRNAEAVAKEQRIDLCSITAIGRIEAGLAYPALHLRLYARVAWEMRDVIGAHAAASSGVLVAPLRFRYAFCLQAAEQ